MNGHDYTALRLPTPLIDQVDHFITTQRQHGFTTRAELLKQAIREFLDKYDGEGSTPSHSNPISPQKQKQKNIGDEKNYV